MKYCHPLKNDQTRVSPRIPWGSIWGTCCLLDQYESVVTTSAKPYLATPRARKEHNPNSGEKGCPKEQRWFKSWCYGSHQTQEDRSKFGGSVSVDSAGPCTSSARNFENLWTLRSKMIRHVQMETRPWQSLVFLVSKTGWNCREALARS